MRRVLMMKEPLFLESVFQERIWGGTALRDKFDYAIPTELTGEYWAISAHPNGPSTVKNGEYAGKTLIDLWDNHAELFGEKKSAVFPLLTKLLDANTDLSVQVHPDDSYANEHENGELGKTECWYIVDCAKDAEIIYGHTALTKEAFIERIEKNEWDALLRRVKIKPGDFFYVPSGTIHALGKGTVVLETQQSSDTTYRLYDYDRKDQDGNLRELHIEKSIDVSTIPHEDAKTDVTRETIEGTEVTTFVQSDFFTVYKWEVSGKTTFEFEPFLLVSVIDGEGEITLANQTYPIKKGDHFILPHQSGAFTVNGKLTIISSHI